MRIKRIGLEHHGKTTLGRGLFGGVLAVDDDFSAGDVFQPGDQPQQR